MVCSDMEQTMEFYTQVLGMPLIQAFDLPDDAGQHFFFDAGDGSALAFFWFRDSPDGVDGLTRARTLPGFGDWISAVGSCNHIALKVPADRYEEMRERLKAAGVRVGPILNHDRSPTQVAPRLQPGVYVRSCYFKDPNGILLELACWTDEFTPDPTSPAPRRESDRRTRPSDAPAISG
jgi:catechol 2,3-dioxygenase-like lactoylglutathione lyase family enzyme